MSDLQGVLALSGIFCGLLFGWIWVWGGLRRRGVAAWLSILGGAVASWTGGLAGLLVVFGIYPWIASEPGYVRWTLLTIGLLLLTSCYLVSRGAPRKGDTPGALSDAAPLLPQKATPEAPATQVAPNTAAKPTPTLPATFAFRYMDGDGTHTERMVKVRAIEEFGSVAYLTGYCDLRKEECTFRSDQISGKLRLVYTPHAYTVEEVVMGHLGVAA